MTNEIHDKANQWIINKLTTDGLINKDGSFADPESVEILKGKEVTEPLAVYYYSLIASAFVAGADYGFANATRRETKEES